LSVTVNPPIDSTDRDTVKRYSDLGVDRVLLSFVAVKREDLEPGLDALCAITD
jgi:hypothetical protein